MIIRSFMQYISCNGLISIIWRVEHITKITKKIRHVLSVKHHQTLFRKHSSTHLSSLLFDWKETSQDKFFFQICHFLLKLFTSSCHVSYFFIRNLQARYFLTFSKLSILLLFHSKLSSFPLLLFEIVKLSLFHLNMPS